MLDLRPIDARLVAPGHAATVIAPAYDALSDEQRQALVAARPDSFLGSLPSGSASVEGLHDNRRHLDRLVTTGRFGPIQHDLLLVLELRDAGRTLTAVIGDIDVAAYLDGRIRPHEHVRADRVVELARYLDEVRIASSPVCVLHEPDASLAATVGSACASPADLDVALPDGAQLRLWSVHDPAVHAVLRDRVRHLDGCTVADGHHRAAAVAHQVGPAASEEPHGSSPHRRVLTAFVPSGQFVVDAFHRRVDGLGEVTEDDLRAVLATRGLALEPLPRAEAPRDRGDVHVTVAGRWWRAHIGDRPGPGLTGHLDASIADRELIGPIAMLAPGPAPARVVPVAAPLGLAALERDGSIGVALAPPSMADLLEVTGAGEVLPHKSTYLAPKLRSGVVVVPR